MKKKPVAKPTTGRRTLSTGAMVAAALPLALSMIPAAVERSKSTPPAETAAVSAVSTGPMLFKPGCELPFDDIKTEGLEVDTKCTIDGNAGDKTAKRLENNAKNNFCAGGKPRPITYDDLIKLQEESDKVPGLRNALKTSRNGLLAIFSPTGQPALGEGTLVQFVAFVAHARHSNVGKGKGENVNCKLTTKEDNDIHIELRMDPEDDDPCNGVTAEMSPHFRPDVWNELVRMKIDRPVRITGPLFFDNSHHPCHGDVRPNPKRISVWEVHPVYQFEICKDQKTTTLPSAACDVKTNSQWIPLDQWQTEDKEIEN